MPINRWFFKSARGNKDDETFIHDGEPKEIPTFQGWIRTRKQKNVKRFVSNGKFIYKEPACLYKGLLYVGRLLTATKIEGVVCAANCRKAMHEFCRCSCGGKNHGIENRDMANAIQEEDVIYLG